MILLVTMDQKIQFGPYCIKLLWCECCWIFVKKKTIWGTSHQLCAVTRCWLVFDVVDDLFSRRRGFNPHFCHITWDELHRVWCCVLWWVYSVVLCSLSLFLSHHLGCIEESVVLCVVMRFVMGVQCCVVFCFGELCFLVLYWVLLYSSFVSHHLGWAAQSGVFCVGCCVVLRHLFIVFCWVLL